MNSPFFYCFRCSFCFAVVGIPFLYPLLLQCLVYYQWYCGEGKLKGTLCLAQLQCPKDTVALPPDSHRWPLLCNDLTDILKKRNLGRIRGIFFIEVRIGVMVFIFAKKCSSYSQILKTTCWLFATNWYSKYLHFIFTEFSGNSNSLWSSS